MGVRCLHTVYPNDGDPRLEKCTLDEGHTDDHDFSHFAWHRFNKTGFVPPTEHNSESEIEPYRKEQIG